MIIICILYDTAHTERGRKPQFLEIAPIRARLEYTKFIHMFMKPQQYGHNGEPIIEENKEAF